MNRNIPLLLAVPIINTVGRWLPGEWTYFITDILSWVLTCCVIWININKHQRPLPVLILFWVISSFFTTPDDFYFKSISITWTLTYCIIFALLPKGVAGVLSLSTLCLTLSNANDELNPNFDPVARNYDEIAFGVLIVIYAGIQIFLHVKRDNYRVV